MAVTDQEMKHALAVFDGFRMVPQTDFYTRHPTATFAPMLLDDLKYDKSWEWLVPTYNNIRQGIMEIAERSTDISIAYHQFKKDFAFFIDHNNRPKAMATLYAGLKYYKCLLEYHGILLTTEFHVLAVPDDYFTIEWISDNAGHLKTETAINKSFSLGQGRFEAYAFRKQLTEEQAIKIINPSEQELKHCEFKNFRGFGFCRTAVESVDTLLQVKGFETAESKNYAFFIKK